MIKSYKHLRQLLTFEDRFDYLKLKGIVGRDTFGFDRYLNQNLYQSKEWLKVRNQVIIRDEGCDLGILDRQIFQGILIHHINPINKFDIETRNPCIFDLNNLICTSQNTHNAIHYGDKSLLITIPKERKKGDTCLWSIVY